MALDPRRISVVLRWIKIQEDQAAMAAAVTRLEERSAAQSAELRDLEARVARIELLRLQRRNPIR